MNVCVLWWWWLFLWGEDVASDQTEQFEGFTEVPEKLHFDDWIDLLSSDAILPLSPLTLPHKASAETPAELSPAVPPRW